MSPQRSSRPWLRRGRIPTRSHETLDSNFRSRLVISSISASACSLLRSILSHSLSESRRNPLFISSDISARRVSTPAKSRASRDSNASNRELTLDSNASNRELRFVCPSCTSRTRDSNASNRAFRLVCPSLTSRTSLNTAVIVGLVVVVLFITIQIACKVVAAHVSSPEKVYSSSYELTQDCDQIVTYHFRVSKELHVISCCAELRYHRAFV